MKYVLIISLIFSVITFAETNSTTNQNNVNVSRIVQQQIKNARQKQNNDRIKILPQKSKENILESSISYFEGMNTTILKLIFLLFSSVAAASVVVVKRKKQNEKLSPEKQLKNNIYLIRKEQLIKDENKKLKKVRLKLRKETDFNETEEYKITSKAKNLNISKGELLLAARIKLHEEARMKKLKMQKSKVQRSR